MTGRINPRLPAAEVAQFILLARYQKATIVRRSLETSVGENNKLENTLTATPHKFEAKQI
jgi:hypothetical protein